MKKAVLLMLPYAGGKAYNLISLANEIAGVEVKILEWPGRGARMHEPLLSDMELIAADLLKQAIPVVAQYHHFAVYGHSMGATAAYMLTHKIAALLQRYPLHLFVSGAAGPATRKKTDWHTLPRVQFWERVKSLGGCPDEIFEALGNFNYAAITPLPLPITVFRGSDDQQDLPACETWQQETTCPLTLIEMDGDHFFIFQNGPAIGRRITETLRYALRNEYAW
jgi:surfactin synthase thioesterase subunit